MERRQGIPVSPGIAIGEALVYDHEGFRIPRRFLTRDAVDDEIERLDKAVAASTAEIERKRERVADAAAVGDRLCRECPDHADGSIRPEQPDQWRKLLARRARPHPHGSGPLARRRGTGIA